MTTITLPRATVEQALEVLLKSHTCPLLPDDCDDAITALRAALAQEPTPPPEARTEAEKTAYAAGWWDALRKAQQAEPVQEPITRLFGTLPVHDAQQAEPDACGYASRLAVAIWEKHYKDAVPQWKPLDDLMGVLTQIDNMTSGLTRLPQQAEPVEPVAWEGWWLHHGQHNYRAKPLTSERVKELMKLAFEVGREAAPPQRKPLSEEEIKDCETQAMVNGALPFEQRVLFARAVERAHGITDPQIADRLARHGIPMPGDPK